jgi:hypothetical protein
MAGKGDSDPRAYIIALVGGAVGGLLGSKATVLLGAYLPVFIFQMGLNVPSDAAGLGETQGGQGVTRFFIVLFASLVPGICGLIVGAIVLAVIHGIDM